MKDMKIEVIDPNLANDARYRGLKLFLHPLDEHPSAEANGVTAAMVAASVSSLLSATQGH
jgi:hypothetical protein